MMIENINYREVMKWLAGVWAKSFIAMLAFFIGISWGQIQTESRIIGDCKYAGAFRVDVQAFMCQRRI